jgi:hypothetical protein
MRVVSNSVAGDARRSKKTVVGQAKIDPKSGLPVAMTKKNSEARIQKSECRRQNSEARSQKPEFRSQNSEVRMQVRASRGPYGLSTASLPLYLLN